MSVVWDTPFRESPLLAAVPPALRAAARRRVLAAGDVVFRQGRRPGAMHCVVAGEIRLVRCSADGGEIVLQRSRGGFVAEASLDARGYHCDALAACDSRLLSFPLPAFRDALHRDTGFNSAWTAHLAAEIRRLRAQCERLSLNGAAERILHYLAAESVDGSLILSGSRKTWAAELGLTHEALYRALRRLREEGRILVAGDRIALRR